METIGMTKEKKMIFRMRKIAVAVRPLPSLPPSLPPLDADVLSSRPPPPRCFHRRCCTILTIAVATIVVLFLVQMASTTTAAYFPVFTRVTAASGSLQCLTT
jgi:hypothetical protein